MDNGKGKAASRPVEKSKTGAGAGASAGAEKRPHAKKRIVNNDQLVEICKRSNGIMVAVAQMLGVGWHTAEKYVKACPEAMEAFQGARETVKDVAESALIRMVNDPKHPRHFDAVVFLLKTLGKERGFTERIENEISGDIKPPPILNIMIEGKSSKGKPLTK